MELQCDCGVNACTSRNARAGRLNMQTAFTRLKEPCGNK